MLDFSTDKLLFFWISVWWWVYLGEEARWVSWWVEFSLQVWVDWQFICYWAGLTLLSRAFSVLCCSSSCIFKGWTSPSRQLSGPSLGLIDCSQFRISSTRILLFLHLWIGTKQLYQANNWYFNRVGRDYVTVANCKYRCASEIERIYVEN